VKADLVQPVLKAVSQPVEVFRLPLKFEPLLVLFKGDALGESDLLYFVWLLALGHGQEPDLRAQQFEGGPEFVGEDDVVGSVEFEAVPVHGEGERPVPVGQFEAGLLLAELLGVEDGGLEGGQVIGHDIFI
jgi:hypothetical protein